MLINVTIDKNNVIQGWTKVPFNYNDYIIDLQKDERIYIGFSQITNPRTEIYKTKKIEQTLDENNEPIIKEIEEEHSYICYDLVENKHLYQEDLKNKQLANKDKEYSNLVEKLIREKYSISDEIAILRQKDEKQEEYEEYYSYAESCKEKAKAIIEEKY